MFNRVKPNGSRLTEDRALIAHWNGAWNRDITVDNGHGDVHCDIARLFQTQSKSGKIYKAKNVE